MRVTGEEITEGFIEIRDAKSRQVITVIEIVSPANKAGGEGQRQYLQKQEDVMQSSSALVEIDFVRGGNHVLMGGKAAIAPEHANHALAAIHVPWRRGLVNLYAFPLRERVKALSIPLRKTDEAVTLNLQGLLDKVYTLGRYELTLDYSEDCAPPLSPEYAVWADTLLKQVGLRPAQAAT